MGSTVYIIFHRQITEQLLDKGIKLLYPAQAFHLLKIHCQFVQQGEYLSVKPAVPGNYAKENQLDA